MNKAIFAGSFDPITNGHISIIKKCQRLFDEVYIVVATNSNKKYLFDKLQRITLIQNAIPYTEKDKLVIICLPDNQTLSDFTKENGIKYNIRGIRNAIDYEYEKSMSEINILLNSEMQTIFIPCEPNLSNISSSTIKEFLKYKKYDLVKTFLPESIFNSVKEHYKSF